MNREVPQAAPTAATVPRDCWNRIGVRGDKSCPELKRHVHCRNCPTHGEAASMLLDRPVLGEYATEWTKYFASPAPVESSDVFSVVIFRVAAEWLALPTAVFREIGELRPIHSLPHRRNRIVVGVANVRGSPVTCVSLVEALGIDPALEKPRSTQGMILRRLMVVSQGVRPLAFVADEVHGIHHGTADGLGPVPATVGKAAATHTKHTFAWRDRAVGYLDEARLFQTLDRSLA